MGCIGSKHDCAAEEFSSEISDNNPDIATLSYSQRPEKIVNGMQPGRADNIPWELGAMLGPPRRRRTRKRRGGGVSGGGAMLLTPSRMHATPQETDVVYRLHGTALALENITSTHHHHLLHFPRLCHRGKGHVCTSAGLYHHMSHHHRCSLPAANNLLPPYHAPCMMALANLLAMVNYCCCDMILYIFWKFGG
jgi:hypothetical protein